MYSGCEENYEFNALEMHFAYSGLARCGLLCRRHRLDFFSELNCMLITIKPKTKITAAAIQHLALTGSVWKEILNCCLF